MLRYSQTTLCVLVLLAARIGYAGDFEDDALTTSKLEQDFLGIHLGCSLDELKTVLAKRSYPIRFNKREEINGMTCYYFSGNHRLKGADGTEFTFWKGKLMEVIVYFGGANAEDVYDSLHLLTTKKYGEMTDYRSGALKGCQAVRGALWITLRYESDPPTDLTWTSILAQHGGLHAAKKENEVQKKAGELGEL